MRTSTRRSSSMSSVRTVERPHAEICHSWAETQKDGAVPSFATRRNDPYKACFVVVFVLREEGALSLTDSSRTDNFFSTKQASTIISNQKLFQAPFLEDRIAPDVSDSDSMPNR